MSSKTRFPAHPVFCLLFLVSSVAVVVPLLIPEYLPLVDWPQHLAVVTVLAEHGNPAYGFDRYIDVGPFMTTYLTFYGGGALLAQLFDVDTAARLLLCLFFVGTPLSLAFLLRTVGRPPHSALAAFPITYCWAFYFGFASYLVSIPLLFFALALVHRQGRKPTWGGGVGLALVCVWMFFTHAFTYLILGLCMLLLAPLVTGRRIGNLARVWAAGVPSLIFFSYWYTWNRSLDLADEIGAGVVALLEAETLRIGFRLKLSELPGNLNDGLAGTIDETFRLVWLIILVSLFLLGCVSALWRRFKGGEKPRTKWGFTVALAVLMICLYFAAPVAVAGVWAVSARLVVVAAFALTLIIPAFTKRRWLASIPYLPMVVLTIWVGMTNAQHFQDFDEEASGLTETLDAMEPGQRVYGLIHNSQPDSMEYPAFLHFPCYYMVQRGGIVGFTFFRQNPSTPLRVRNPAEVPNAGRRVEWEPSRFRHTVHGPFYDALLIRGSSFQSRRPGGAPENTWELVARHGKWAALTRSDDDVGIPVYSFLQRVHRAEVTQTVDSAVYACERVGLRWNCPHADWTWVGPSLQSFAGIELECIWAHPFPGGVPSATFTDIPSDAAVMRGFLGIDDVCYDEEGPCEATLTISVNGEVVSTLETSPRKGYSPFYLEIPKELTPIESVAFTTGTGVEGRNQLCFNATLFTQP